MHRDLIKYVEDAAGRYGMVRFEPENGLFRILQSQSGREQRRGVSKEGEKYDISNRFKENNLLS